MLLHFQDSPTDQKHVLRPESFLWQSRCDPITLFDREPVLQTMAERGGADWPGRKLCSALRQFVGQAPGKASSDAAVKADILHRLQLGPTSVKVTILTQSLLELQGSFHICSPLPK